MVAQVSLLALLAGQEILKIYRSGDWRVTSKPDESPLTQADLMANEVILKGLHRFSEIPVFSEEDEKTSGIGAPSSVPRRFWLVDPLDGTRDFVARLDTFVVSIGLVEDGYPILGVVFAPVLGELYWAEQGKGAWKAFWTMDGVEPQVSNLFGERLTHSVHREKLIAAGSRSQASERMQFFYDHFKIEEVIRFGSALKFCRLAQGEVDLYPRFGPTHEWDTVAGQIIAEEAGCKVLDIATGERLRYGKPDLLNKGGFMASRNDLDLMGPLRAAGLLKSQPSS